MSLGWLSETSFIPKKAKKIEVDKSSLMSIKAFIDKEKGKNPNSQILGNMKSHAVIKQVYLPYIKP